MGQVRPIATIKTNEKDFKVEPDFGMKEQIVILDIQDVFKIDALESSHPISVQVNDPNEINELFDDISYAKGKCKNLDLPVPKI